MNIREILQAVAIYESNFEKKMNIDMVNSLMALYQQAIEYFSANNDPQYDSFVNRLHSFLSNDVVLTLLASENDATKPKAEKSPKVRVDVSNEDIEEHKFTSVKQELIINTPQMQQIDAEATHQRIVPEVEFEPLQEIKQEIAAESELEESKSEIHKENEHAIIQASKEENKQEKPNDPETGNFEPESTQEIIDENNETSEANHEILEENKEGLEINQESSSPAINEDKPIEENKHDIHDQLLLDNLLSTAEEENVNTLTQEVVNESIDESRKEIIQKLLKDNIEESKENSSSNESKDIQDNRNPAQSEINEELFSIE